MSSFGKDIIFCCAFIDMNFCASTDPCVDYIFYNDTQLNTIYSGVSSGQFTLQPNAIGHYHRYGNTESGVMATSCPATNECGSQLKIWISGMFKFVIYIQ